MLLERVLIRAQSNVYFVEVRFWIEKFINELMVVNGIEESMGLYCYNKDVIGRVKEAGSSLRFNISTCKVVDSTIEGQYIATSDAAIGTAWFYEFIVEHGVVGSSTNPLMRQ